MRTAAVWTALAAVAAIASPGQAANVWMSIDPYVSPAHPREDLSITVGAYGVWPDSCVPIDQQVVFYTGNVISVDFYSDPFASPFCFGVPTDFGTQASVILPAGTYDLYASLFTNMAWFPFDPPEWQLTHTQYLTSFSVYYPGDVNFDGAVDVVDLLYLVDAFGSMAGDPNYDARCDFNSDGYVDVVDLLTLVEHFGT
jgi:hypothetical protein